MVNFWEYYSEVDKRQISGGQKWFNIELCDLLHGSYASTENFFHFKKQNKEPNDNKKNVFTTNNQR